MRSNELNFYLFLQSDIRKQLKYLRKILVYGFKANFSENFYSHCFRNESIEKLTLKPIKLYLIMLETFLQIS